eukprot:2506721-Rhodomonas_salina.6
MLLVSAGHHIERLEEHYLKYPVPVYESAAHIASVLQLYGCVSRRDCPNGSAPNPEPSVTGKLLRSSPEQSGRCSVTVSSLDKKIEKENANLISAESPACARLFKQTHWKPLNTHLRFTNVSSEVRIRPKTNGDFVMAVGSTGPFRASVEINKFGSFCATPFEATAILFWIVNKLERASIGAAPLYTKVSSYVCRDQDADHSKFESITGNPINSSAVKSRSVTTTFSPVKIRMLFQNRIVRTSVIRPACDGAYAGGT